MQADGVGGPDNLNVVTNALPGVCILEYQARFFELGEPVTTRAQRDRMPGGQQPPRVHASDHSGADDENAHRAPPFVISQPATLTAAEYTETDMIPTGFGCSTNAGLTCGAECPGG